MDMGTGRLTRIMTVPPGGEASGVYWHRNVNGHGYLTAIVQHPFANNVEAKGAKLPSNDPKHRQGVVGVIGPFPVAKAK